MAHFSDLPEELIELFMKRIPSIQDSIKCGAVCKSWHLAAAANRKTPKLCLMLTKDDTDAQNLRTFYTISNKTEFTVKMHDIQGRKCWGTPFGWLITVGLDCNINLLNPLSGVQLSLPPQNTFGDQYKYRHEPEYVRASFTTRFAASSNPSEPSSCTVMAIYSQYRKLAFAKPGDKAWTPIKSIPHETEPPPLDQQAILDIIMSSNGRYEDEEDYEECQKIQREHQSYKDVTYFNGQFYAIDMKGILVVCDIDSPHPEARQIASYPDPSQKYGQLYLVEMSGVLHMVAQKVICVEDLIEVCHYQTVGFVVYRFDFQAEKWTELSDLGEHALFVGSCSSFSVSTSAHKELKRNSVYYTDFHTTYMMNKSFSDMGVYNYEEQTFEPVYSGTDVFSTISRPFFIPLAV